MTMSRRFAFVFGLVTALGLPFAAWAQKDKSPSLPSGDMFFTGKGAQPISLERTFPGITGALLLTDEQKQNLHAVREETVDSQAVREASLLLKTKVNATEAARTAARKTMDDARAKLQKEVAQILTPDQNVLVEKINIAASEAQRAALEKYQADYAAAKGNENQLAELNKKFHEEAREEFARKMNNILTAGQKDAWQKAAAAQKAAEENSDKNKTK
jgi:Spy/CpxP family protein refolding chaperone